MEKENTTTDQLFVRSVDYIIGGVLEVYGYRTSLQFGRNGRNGRFVAEVIGWVNQCLLKKVDDNNKEAAQYGFVAESITWNEGLPDLEVGMGWAVGPLVDDTRLAGPARRIGRHENLRMPPGD